MSTHNTHDPLVDAVIGDPAPTGSAPGARPFDPRHITRPDPVLWTYYLVVSLLTGPFSPLALLAAYCKYRTLHYQFDNDGIRMSWGVFFKREVTLTYRRIQDIHVTRGLIQRWFGLATVAIQTASGSATPEMSIEGILEADALRDYLYTKMRGAKGLNAHPAATPHAGAAPPASTAPTVQSDEALTLLREIRDALRSLPQAEARS